MKSLIRMTREVYHCYMDDEGNLHERPIGTIGKRNLDKKRDDFLRRYITLIMNTRIVSDTTKIYIKSSLPSIASVIIDYNLTLKEHEQIKIKTAQSKVDYDSRKLLKYFPDNMLNQVLGYNSSNIDDYEKRLTLAIADYGKKNKMLTNLEIKLPKVNMQDDLSEEEFHDFLKIVAPYFKKHKQYVEGNLSEKSVGYIYYLLYTPQLTKEHKERYQLLKAMLED